MAKYRLREDKSCQNCGTFVEKNFCPECGQKNTNNRKHFYLLFLEFFSGLINYDNSFWRTIRLLVLSPGKLSKEYIIGKRASYLDPVKLYLFSSFLVFFIPAILPNFNEAGNINFININEFDLNNEIDMEDVSIPSKTKYGVIFSENQLDSIHYSLPKEKRISNSEYILSWAVLRTFDKIRNPNFVYQIKNFIVDNLPKVIFTYMPIFAFLLWLFHSKKKWYYFDSGVFTLHFFSFVLLTLSLLFILDYLLEYQLGMESLFNFIIFISWAYITFYFFRAHRRFYGNSRFVSRLIAGLLVMINFIFMVLIFTSYFILALLI